MKKDQKGKWTVKKHREVMIKNKQKKINWKIFFENRSTIDALWDFCFGFHPKIAFKNIRFPKEVVEQIKVIKKNPKRARILAKKATGFYS